MRKNSFLAFVILVAASSCVNKEYDITKPIDMEMNVGGQIEIPLPGKDNSFSYSLGGILLPDGQTDGILKKNEDGSLMFVVEPTKEIVEKYTFGQIAADDCEKGDSRTFVALESAIGQELDYPVKIPMSLQVSGIDSSVETIREADLDALLTLSVKTVDGTRISIKSGYKFTLPEFIFIDESTLPSFAEIDAAAKNAGHRNVIVIKETQTFDGIFSLSCHINKLELSGFGANEGKMHLEGDATADGKIAFLKFALADKPFPIETVMKITDVAVKSVTMKASPTISAESQEIAVGDVPEALNDIEFELADVGFFVSAENETPFNAGIAANIFAVSGGTTAGPVVVDGSKSGFYVTANTSGEKFCLSESGEYGTAADRKIKVAGLMGLVSPIPEKILVSDIVVNGVADSKDGFVTVVVGKEYHLGFSYRIEAPLSFKSLKLRRDENIDINFDLDEVSFDDLYIRANVTSTLPLDAKLSFALTDSEGNAVQGVNVMYEDEDGNAIDELELAAGSLTGPVVKPLKIVLAADAGTHISKLQTLRLHIEAGSPEGKVVTLNAEQSISISDIIVGTTSGVFVDGNDKTPESDRENSDWENR